MPFVKKIFYIQEEIKAFLYLINRHNLSQGDAQRLIAKGRLLIDGESMRDSSQIIHGEIELVYFEPKSRGVSPLFSTLDFMIFEKQSGLLVHPNTMATEYSMLDEIRHIAGRYSNAVHRIDMETSGLLMASKHKSAERSLKMLFEKRAIKKSYLAWVDGKVTDSFEVNEPLRVRDDYSQCKHKVEVHTEGKASLTHFKPLKYDEELDATLIACHPHTGRTHQIRVHLFHVKHPILGDPIYGTDFKASDEYLEGRLSDRDRLVSTGASRLMLHAQSLRFQHKSDFYIESRVDFEGMKREIIGKNDRVFYKS
ncbi:MAG: RluA family pseudouridine synthase [Campylobacterota bacterium]|nr:RluA family pseudouridine synthase [Campylobacterota bacterium]